MEQLREIGDDIAKCTEAKSGVKEKMQLISSMESRVEATEAHVMVVQIKMLVTPSNPSLATKESTATENRKYSKY